MGGMGYMDHTELVSPLATVVSPRVLVLCLYLLVPNLACVSELEVATLVSKNCHSLY